MVIFQVVQLTNGACLFLVISNLFIFGWRSSRPKREVHQVGAPGLFGFWVVLVGTMTDRSSITLRYLRWEVRHLW